ncbi:MULTISPECIES: lipopolysaccharide transport periplasmic protein LptA [unclassified Zymobacter]|uniref:lipopolysaccharide transport periplasmic protein LptA n=1 Tax=unclassified Zymobacter TaxID=3048685 RepID=UPI0039C0DE0E
MSIRWLTPLMAAVGIAAGLTTTSTLALDSDARQPIRVSAGQLQLDDRNGSAIYSGTVHIEQGSMKLDADQVVLTRSAAGGLSTMRATGKGKRAYIEQKPSPQEGLVKGWGDTIVYSADSRKVELIGHAELHRGTDTFTGAYVQYFMNTRQVQAQGAGKNNTGSGRIEMTISPDAR